jgi:hypothetical protein
VVLTPQGYARWRTCPMRRKDYRAAQPGKAGLPASPLGPVGRRWGPVPRQPEEVKRPSYQ